MKPVRAKSLLNLMADRLHTLPLVVLYLTDGCNSRCVMCDIWRSPRRNMALALVDEIAAACADLGVRWLLLSGGEAMQHPHWPEIARRFRAQGVYVMLLTNGLLLRKQADEVLDGVDEVIVSLDGGTAETYHAIRGVDAFDLVLDGIRAVNSLPVITRTTIQRANYREMPQIIEAAKTAGASRISFLTVDVSNPFAFGPRFAADPDLTIVPAVHSNGNTLNPAALTAEDVRAFARVLDEVEVRFAEDFATGIIAESPHKLRRMVRYFQALLGEGEYLPPRCNAPHFSAVIEVDGTLRPCYFLPSYGRVETGVPLRQSINSSAAQALRQAYRTGQRAECARCVCPLYKGPRSLLRM